MIAVISPGYVKSKVCLDELSRAKQRGRTVFPVLLEPVEPSDWPLELQRVQYEDFTAWRDSSTFAAATSSLVARLGSDLSEVIGQRPDAEQQYLLSLIADLESRVGVARHIALAAELRELDHDAQAAPAEADAWRVDPEFYLLDAGTPAAERVQKGSKVTFDDLATVPRRFVITGAPGAGKTTTLLHLALRFARARLEEPRTNPLPVYLSLPDWVREASPQEFVASRWPIDADALTAIASDDVVFLFDGLNEMGRRGYANSVALRDWLRSRRAPQRAVFTCRSRDYPELDLGIDEANVRPLDLDQIKRFAEAYLQDDASSFLRRVVPGGIASSDPRSLYALAQNPYLLFSLILLHRGKQELPRNMGRLFHRLSEFLWNKERLHHTVDWVPFDEARPRLARLAFEMTESNASTRIPESMAETYLGDRFALLTALGANILDRSETGLQFFHQRIQEYFAAAELARLGIGALAERMSVRWSEVVIAAAGLTSESEEFVACVRGRDTLLAAECLVSGVEVSPQLSGKIEDELSSRLDDVGPKVVQKEIERSPGSRMMIEDRVGDYFASYHSLGELVHKVRSGERFVDE
jgi:hypothetical protein